MRYDPFAPEFQADPYPAYRWLREQAPVHHAPGSDVWCVARYEDVAAVLRDPETFSSVRPTPVPGLVEMPLWRRLWLAGRVLWKARGVIPRDARGSRQLLGTDGEAHASLREIVNRGFTPRRIASWEPRIREVVAECMERLRERPRFDLVEDLAIPLPVTIISEMLGVDPERQLDFKRWSDDIIRGSTGSGRADPARSGLIEAVIELTRYLGPLIKERRRAPAEDLISVIVGGQEGATLSDFEVVLFVVVLLIAGNETTTNLLGNTVDALLDHPEVLEQVAADPARVPALIEEGLRYDSPVQFVQRRTTRDVEVAGVWIPAEAEVVPLIGSANRDPARFPDPDRLDPERDTRGHLAFGFGVHFCLGASLARLEARAALEALLPELPGLVRARPEREFLDSFLVRGRARLELQKAA